MKKSHLVFLTAICILLCGCVSGYAEETNGQTRGHAVEAVDNPAEELVTDTDSTSATPVPVTTPAPIPELHFPDGSIHKILERRVNLSDLSHKDVEEAITLLRQFPKLRYVNLGEAGTEETPRAFGWEDVGTLQQALPEVEFRYGFTLFGKHFTTLDEEMNFHHVTMDDDGEAVREVLPYMTKCRLLDMDFSGVPSERMAEIRDSFPDIKVVWRIWFGANCSVRTDVERILASNLDHKLTDDNTRDLIYCTKVRFLDIGHNTMLKDFRFLEYMPDLEVAILCITGLEDLTPISGCTKMEYLELNTLYDGQGLDLSPLGNLTDLEHLDICRLGNVQGWQALEKLTKLKRLWIGRNTWLPDGAKEELEAALPNTEINWTADGGSDGDWRYNKSYNGYHERYQLLRKQFEYSDYTNVSSAWYNDPLYYKEGEPRYRPSDWW